MSRHRCAPPTCSAASATAGELQGLLHDARRRPRRPDEARGHPVEDQRRLLPGHVDGLQRPAGEPRPARRRRTGSARRRPGPPRARGRRSCRRARTTCGRRARTPRRHRRARVCSRSVLQLPSSSGTASVAMVVPAAMPGRMLPLRRRIPARLQRVHGEDRGGEVRRAEQHAAHLLEHDELLDGAAARAAVLLRDRQPLQPELLRHLRPDRAVVALVGLHQPPDLPRRRLVLEEAAQAAPELLLLLAEREGHDVSSPLSRLRADLELRGTAPPSTGQARAGSPSTRSPMMLRWIWSVPP